MAKGAFDGSFFSKGGGGGYTKQKRKEYEDWKASIAERAATTSLKTAEPDKPSGGGGILGKLKSVISGAGNFVKDAAVDVKNTTVDTWQGIGDVARGYRAEQDVKHKTEVMNERNKMWREKFGNASDKQWKDPKFVAEAKKFTEETKRLGQISANTQQDLQSQQDVNAKELAFKSAETVLNLAPVVGGVGKTIGKQAAKTAAKEAIKIGGMDAAEQLVKAAGKQTGKKVAEKVAEGTLFGAAYGATNTGKRDPNASAAEIARGAAIGGAVGGAVPLVAEGVSKVAGKITNKAQIAEKDLVPDAVVQIKDKDGNMTYQRIPKDQYEEIVKKIDGDRVTSQGIAGKADANGNVYHITASSPEKMAKAGFMDGGVYKLPDTEIRDSGIKAKINEVFQPTKNLGKDTQASFKANAGGRNVAEVKARYVEKNLQKAADEAGVKLDMNLAHQIENGTAPDNAFTQQFREIADKTRQEAVDAGLDIGYREDYVPHIWDKSPEEVDKIARGAGMKPTAGYKRIVPTYEEGLKLGLKPKYDDPAKMMGAYVRNLENTRTNVALLTDLREQGLLKSGRPPTGWKTVTAEGFPRTKDGNMLSAPKEVARVLNNLYGNSDSVIDKALRKTAAFNSKWQDIALAGGIPGTPANFFTFSQMMKEGSLGLGQLVTGSPIQGAKTIYSPVAAFARSFSKKQTEKFFEANSGFVESMAKRGVKILPNEGTGKWDKLFNEPTFGKFMPNLQLNTAKNVQNALEKKIGREAALDATAEVMKKMYGITDQLATGRSQAVQDAIGTIAFAPKYRESIMSVLGNTIKSVADPRTYADRSYSLNRRLAVGLGATYMLYDQLNRQTMGHGMNQNPEGKELTLAIPYGGKDEKGNQKVVYIPFMPSFLTLPRAAVGAAKGIAKGDMDAVAAEGGKFLSMPIQTVSQIASNKDYFGRPIVNDEAAARANRTEEDSNLTKLKKRALYVAGQSTPAAVRAGMGAAQGKPLEQNLAQAGEAPVRFGTLSPKSDTNRSFSPGQVTGDFYDVYNPLVAKRTATSKKVTELVKQGRINEARRKAEEYNMSLQGKFGKYYKKYGGNPTDDPMWDEMLGGLFIKTTETAFKARSKQ